MKKEDYFGLITNRIMEIQTEIKNTQKDFENYKVYQKDRSRKIKSYELKIEFLMRKIQYLKSLEALPLYIAIIHLPNKELRMLRTALGKENVSLETFRDYLIQICQLQKIETALENPETRLADYIEVEQMNFDAIVKLLLSQKRNKELEDKKQSLTSRIEIPLELLNPTFCSVFEPDQQIFSYLQLEELETKIDQYEDKMNQAVTEIAFDYTEGIVEEVRFYRDHFSQIPHLSESFIRTHIQKATKIFPELIPNMKQLSRSSSLFVQQWIPKKIRDKFFPIHRSEERRFLDCVLDFYKHNNAFSFFGQEVENILDQKPSMLKKQLFQVEQSELKKREKINQLRSSIRKSKLKMLKKIREYELLQENEKIKFMRALYSINPSIPKQFATYFFEDNHLKYSLINAFCAMELGQFSKKLSESIPNDHCVKEIVQKSNH